MNTERKDYLILCGICEVIVPDGSTNNYLNAEIIYVILSIFSSYASAQIFHVKFQIDIFYLISCLEIMRLNKNVRETQLFALVYIFMFVQPLIICIRLILRDIFLANIAILCERRWVRYILRRFKLN